jgi:hypothetical protein
MTEVMDSAEGHTGEAPGGFEPPIRVLQTPALPLGYGAIFACRNGKSTVSAARGLAGASL